MCLCLLLRFFLLSWCQKQSFTRDSCSASNNTRLDAKHIFITPYYPRCHIFCIFLYRIIIRIFIFLLWKRFKNFHFFFVLFIAFFVFLFFHKHFLSRNRCENNLSSKSSINLSPKSKLTSSIDFSLSKHQVDENGLIFRNFYVV